jgi:hypothetical protein
MNHMIIRLTEFQRLEVVVGTAKIRRRKVQPVPSEAGSSRRVVARRITGLSVLQE